MVSLIAGTIMLYVIGYVAFQRQEVQGVACTVLAQQQVRALARIRYASFSCSSTRNGRW